MKPENLLKKSYSLCYHLTGDIQLAQKLCLEILEDVSWNSIFFDDNAFIEISQKATKLLLEKHYDYSLRQLQAGDPAPEIITALNSLPLEERMVVVLHDVYRLPDWKISQVLEQEDTNRLLHLGRMRLKQLLNTSK